MTRQVYLLFFARIAATFAGFLITYMLVTSIDRSSLDRYFFTTSLASLSAIFALGGLPFHQYASTQYGKVVLPTSLTWAVLACAVFVLLFGAFRSPRIDVAIHAYILSLSICFRRLVAEYLRARRYAFLSQSAFIFQPIIMLCLLFLTKFSVTWLVPNLLVSTTLPLIPATLAVGRDIRISFDLSAAANGYVFSLRNGLSSMGSGLVYDGLVVLVSTLGLPDQTAAVKIFVQGANLSQTVISSYFTIAQAVYSEDALASALGRFKILSAAIFGLPAVVFGGGVTEFISKNFVPVTSLSIYLVVALVLANISVCFDAMHHRYRLLVSLKENVIVAVAALGLLLVGGGSAHVGYSPVYVPFFYIFISNLIFGRFPVVNSRET